MTAVFRYWSCRMDFKQSLMAAALAAVIVGPSVAADSSDFDTAKAHVAELAKQAGKSRRAKNVILFVGDGMGISTITAARILEGQNKGQSGEDNRLSFEEFPQAALVRTFSANQQVSDSAPTATAMMTGWHANDGALSVGPEVADNEMDATRVAAHANQTILELAEARGLATGIVSTARITHATPGATYAHTPNRDWEYAGQMPATATLPDIGAQLIARQRSGNGIEVVLGGGRGYLLDSGSADPEYPDEEGKRRDGRNLVREWLGAQPQSQYVWKRDDLMNVDVQHTDHLLGLFEPSHMQYETDRGQDPAGEPSLAEMTSTAIQILQKSRKGFFLMVEAGRIDHANHAGNAYRALTDTIALSDAVRTAVEMTRDKDTLILVTADHSHVLTIAGYPARGNPILGLVKAPGASGPVLDTKGKPYTTLSYATGPGFSVVDEKGGGRREVNPGRNQDLADFDTTSPDFHQESLVGLGAETHGGEDVGLFAHGASANLVHGVINQNEIYHIMRRALGL
jgi:alkaline phosphatase